jgi:hypothetical protein
MANLQWILYKMGSLEKLYKMTLPTQIFSSGFLTPQLQNQHLFTTPLFWICILKYLENAVLVPQIRAYNWPARRSLSMRSALNVPGSSLKSSLNMEYALRGR